MGKSGLAKYPFPPLDLIETTRMDSSPASLFGAWVQLAFLCTFPAENITRPAAFTGFFMKSQGIFLLCYCSILNDSQPAKKQQEQDPKRGMSGDREHKKTGK